MGRGVVRRRGTAAALVCLLALAAAGPAGSAGAAKRKPKAKPPVLTIATPKQGRVSAVVLTFKRKAGAKAPRMTLAARYRGPKTVAVAAGVFAWANTPTQWVALVTVVNFKPPPPTPATSGGRALAATPKPPPLRFRAPLPYRIAFRGTVRVDRGVRRFVIQSFASTTSFARRQTGIAPAYAKPAILLGEVRFALAGLPHVEFADAVLGRTPVAVP